MPNATPSDDPTAQQLEDLLGRLDLPAKVRLLTGANHWELWGEPAIGLRPVVVADGPSGVRGTTWDERDPSASLPSSMVSNSTLPSPAVRTWVRSVGRATARSSPVRTARRSADAASVS